MRAHVIGNGFSWKFFKKIEESDFVLGCNNPNVKVDATVILDLRFFYKVLQRIDPIILDCPIITNNKCKKTYENPKYHYCKDKIIIKDVYSVSEKFKRSYDLPSNKSGLNSAHFGTLWLIENGYDEIHVWGCNSIFEYSFLSTTDSIVEADYKSEVNKSHIDIWRKNWELINTIYPNINLIYHDKE